mmetsp:Transcript_60828/g.177791  ORF Transcript_60828/g.177791 Transcript_60828/m.177791 type:complete len:209 (+) Transcript_60828:163-789(+)
MASASSADSRTPGRGCRSRTSRMCLRQAACSIQYLVSMVFPALPYSTRHAYGCALGVISTDPALVPTHTRLAPAFAQRLQSSGSSTRMKSRSSTLSCCPYGRSCGSAAWLSRSPAFSAGAGRAGGCASGSARDWRLASRNGSSTTWPRLLEAEGEALVAAQSTHWTARLGVSCLVLYWGCWWAPSMSSRSIPPCSRRSPSASMTSRHS